MSQQTTNIPDDRQLDRLISARFSSSFMSDSKWIKLISELVANAELVKDCKIRLIWDNANSERRLLIDKHRAYNFDFYAKSMEAMVTGRTNGWTMYKEIEWIEFPKEVTDRSNRATKQDIAAIQTIVNKLGQFNIECTDSYLRIYAYRS